MIEYLYKEIDDFCNEDVLEKIESNFGKIVGIKTWLGGKDENDKMVGTAILLLNCEKKIILGHHVQFDEDKIKWKSQNTTIDDDGNEYGFFLVDPYWVKPWTSDPKIKVPIKVFIENEVKTETRELTFEAFQQQRLKEFYLKEKVPYIIVEAYRNFYKLKKPGQYYKAINSTVKHYFIPEEKLKSIISTINHERNRIKREWMNILKESYAKKQINTQLAEFKLNKKADVIHLKRD
jgi:hypothetical protein